MSVEGNKYPQPPPNKISNPLHKKEKHLVCQ
jgi:hypothetical protein